MYVFKGRVFLSGKVRRREGNGKKFTHPIHRSRILLLTKLPATQASLKKNKNKQKKKQRAKNKKKTKTKRKQKKNKNKNQKENKENQKYLEQGRNLPDSLVWATGKLKCEQQ